MTDLSPPQLQQLAAIVQQLLPNHCVANWSSETGLLGEIAEFDSMTLTQLLTAIESGFAIEIDDDLLSLEAFASWGALQQLVQQLLAA